MSNKPIISYTVSWSDTYPSLDWNLSYLKNPIVMTYDDYVEDSISNGYLKDALAVIENVKQSINRNNDQT